MTKVLTLADLPQLVKQPATSFSSIIEDKTRALKLELNALKPQVRQASVELDALQQKLKTVKAKLAHLPGNPRLLKEQEELVELVVESQARMNDLVETITQVRHNIDAIVIAAEQARMKDLAQERIPAIQALPVEDPLEKSLLLSDMARGLQRREISKRKYYSMLIDRTYKRSDDGNGGPSTNPEMDDGAINRIEEMRAQLEEITVLRMAIEIVFDKVIDDLPETAPFIPKLLSRTDEQTEAQLAEWNAQRNAKSAIERDTINDGHQGIAAMEKAIYQPRQFAKAAQKKPEMELPDL